MKLEAASVFRSPWFLGVGFFGPTRRWPVICSLLIASTIDESSQRLFPTRTFDLGDLAMNVVGIVALGPIAAWVTRGWRRLPGGAAGPG